MNSSYDLQSPAGVGPATDRRVSLCEALDRMLNTGVVVAGEVVISVADIDLVYLNVQLLLASIETACGLPRYPAGEPKRIPSAP